LTLRARALAFKESRRIIKFTNHVHHIAEEVAAVHLRKMRQGQNGESRQMGNPDVALFSKKDDTDVEIRFDIFCEAACSTCK